MVDLNVAFGVVVAVVVLTNLAWFCVSCMSAADRRKEKEEADNGIVRLLQRNADLRSYFRDIEEVLVSFDVDSSDEAIEAVMQALALASHALNVDSGYKAPVFSREDFDAQFDRPPAADINWAQVIKDAKDAAAEYAALKRAELGRDASLALYEDDEV